MIALELIDDSIVARMFKISVIHNKIIKEHYFAGLAKSLQLLLVHLRDLFVFSEPKIERIHQSVWKIIIKSSLSSIYD